MSPARTATASACKPEALAVTVGGQNPSRTSATCPWKGRDFFSWDLSFSDEGQMIAAPILKEIDNRLSFLTNVGLRYLTLSRAAATLSGGEAQRIRLATQIGSGLMGVLYILDEPSIGLHQRDNHKLLRTLTNLRDLGNTLIVVEHDEETLRSADYLVDIGPGAGEHGGEVVAQGSVEDLMKSERSITGQYLSGRLSIPVPEAPPQAGGLRSSSGRPGAQPEKHRRRLPPGGLHLRHRRLRLRKVLPGERDPLQDAGWRRI